MAEAKATTPDTTTETEAPKGVQVSTIVPPEHAAFLDEIRWTRRIDKRADVLREAIAEYVENHKDEVPAAK